MTQLAFPIFNSPILGEFTAGLVLSSASEKTGLRHTGAEHWSIYCGRGHYTRNQSSLSFGPSVVTAVPGSSFQILVVADEGDWKWGAGSPETERTGEPQLHRKRNLLTPHASFLLHASAALWN